MNGVALFAGIGGLDLGLNFILPDSRTVCYVEGETYAATLLSKKMRQGVLADAPIYSDVKTFSSVAHVFGDKVDFITAGFPCQPFSTAGDRKGTSDERWLWFDIMDIIGVLRPNFLFLENVSNILNDREAFSTILRTLAEVGYCIEWATLKASDVGANHQRNRLFIFAYQRSGIELLDRLVTLTYSDCERFYQLHPPTEPSEKKREDFHSLSNRNNRTPSWWQSEPDVRRVDDGVSFGMDRLRGLGNAVVPLQAANAFYNLIQRGLQS